MHQHDILRAWIAGICKTGTEQEQVDRLADVLDSLLAHEGVQQLKVYREYSLIRAQARDLKPHGPGILTLSDAIIDLSDRLRAL